MPEDGRRHFDSKEAPHSRLFIIGPKNLNEDDFRNAFESFGKVEDIFVVKDRITGENKGVTYIKFAKTSQAAKALEAMNGESIGSGRPLKVMIASKPEEGSKEVDFEEISHRLFVIVPKTMNDTGLFDAFKKFGHIYSARIVRDRNTQESKGVAYVKFSKFSEAADAFENCDSTFRAVFARPKKPIEERDDYNRGFVEEPRFASKRGYPEPTHDFPVPGRFPDGGFHKLFVTANPMLNQDQIWRLFDVIPTMDFCDVHYDAERAYAEVVYKNSHWASYAKQKFHGFEYPPGHRLIVKSEFEPDMSRGAAAADPKRENILKLAETLVQATSQMKKTGRTPDISELLQPLLGGSGPGPSSFPSDEYDLPHPKPLVRDVETKKRCFVVCHPKSLPPPVLRDLFCRFGNLIDVYLLKGKNFGYAMYASEASANNAIRELHGFDYNGVKLKVVEAEDRPDNKKMKMDY